MVKRGGFWASVLGSAITAGGLTGAVNLNKPVEPKTTVIASPINITLTLSLWSTPPQLRP